MSNLDDQMAGTVLKIIFAIHATQTGSSELLNQKLEMESGLKLANDDYLAFTSCDLLRC